MSFIWPPALLALALIPPGLLLYWFVGRRRRRRLATFGGEGTRAEGGLAGRIGGRIPALLVLVGLTVMTVALARPQAVVGLPREEGTVILAFDVSDSMAATDLAPTRIAAAKVAAKDFVSHEPVTVAIGVVAFSDSGVSVQTPTNDQASVIAAIDRLAPQKGTSLAQGIGASLKAISVAAAGPWAGDYYTQQTAAPTATPTPVPSGVHAPAVVILLTDGENNESPDPLVAARSAADQGVRIYTVGIGSAAGSTLNLNGFQVHTQLDEAMLRQISQITGGTYYNATDAAQLDSIYGNIDVQVVLQPQLTELTPIFAGFAALLLAAGAVSSLLWLGRMP